jgi:hypothetical protein
MQKTARDHWEGLCSSYKDLLRVVSVLSLTSVYSDGFVDGTFLGCSGYEKDSSDDDGDSPDYGSGAPIAGQGGNPRYRYHDTDDDATSPVNAAHVLVHTWSHIIAQR